MKVVYVEYNIPAGQSRIDIEKKILETLAQNIELFKRELIVVFSKKKEETADGYHLTFEIDNDLNASLINVVYVHNEIPIQLAEMLAALNMSMDLPLTEISAISMLEGIEKIHDKADYYPELTSDTAYTVKVFYGRISWSMCEYAFITHVEKVNTILTMAKEQFIQTYLLPADLKELAMEIVNPENPNVGKINIEITPTVTVGCNMVSERVLDCNLAYTHNSVSMTRAGYTKISDFGVDNIWSSTGAVTTWITKYITALTYVLDNLSSVTSDSDLKETLSNTFKAIINQHIVTVGNLVSNEN